MTDVPNITLLWVDIETTGLNYENDIILEMAWQMTTYLGEPLHDIRSFLTIDKDDEDMLKAVLERYIHAPDVVKQMHANNGLWNEILFSTTAPRAGFWEVIERLYQDLDEHRKDTEVRFAGSSVHFDKRFIEEVSGEVLPISHRVHDLSTLRPFLQWQGFDVAKPVARPGELEHRASIDIQRDIEQWHTLSSFLVSEMT